MINQTGNFYSILDANNIFRVYFLQCLRGDNKTLFDLCHCHRKCAYGANELEEYSLKFHIFYS